MELHGGFFCNNNAYALKNIARLRDQIIKFSNREVTVVRLKQKSVVLIVELSDFHLRVVE
jgi:hypothetical protein